MDNHLRKDDHPIETFAYASKPVSTAAHGRDVLILTIAALCPFVLMAAYLFITRGLLGTVGVGFDVPALLFSLTIGAELIWLSSIPIWTRILLTIVYLPVMLGGLLQFSCVFVCYAFGDCL